MQACITRYLQPTLHLWEMQGLLDVDLNRLFPARHLTPIEGNSGRGC
jgi:hypothetical protein